jgi:hypothetical protein
LGKSDAASDEGAGGDVADEGLPVMVTSMDTSAWKQTAAATIRERCSAVAFPHHLGVCRFAVSAGVVPGVVVWNGSVRMDIEGGR